MSHHDQTHGAGREAGGGLPWCDMRTAPFGQPIIARHKPTSRMPHGWVATICLGHGDHEEPGVTDTILHYNGDDLLNRFHGVWTGWLPLDAAPAVPAGGGGEAITRRDPFIRGHMHDRYVRGEAPTGVYRAASGRDPDGFELVSEAQAFSDLGPKGDYLSRSPAEKVRIDYTNYRGERGIRTITPWGVEWGSTEFHPEPQWLVTGYDHDKHACRVYALRDIHAWNGVPTQNPIALVAQPRAGSPSFADALDAISPHEEAHSYEYRPDYAHYDTTDHEKSMLEDFATELLEKVAALATQHGGSEAGERELAATLDEMCGPRAYHRINAASAGEAKADRLTTENAALTERVAALEGAPIVEFHQQDWIPGFAAFLPKATTPPPNSRAFCVLNVGSLMATVASGDVPPNDLPGFVVESLIHEVGHVVEQWAKVEFSEERVEALTEKYRTALASPKPSARDEESA